MPQPYPDYVGSPNNRPLGDGQRKIRHDRPFDVLETAEVLADVTDLRDASRQVGLEAPYQVVCARVKNACGARVVFFLVFVAVLLFFLVYSFSECFWVAVVTNENYLDCFKETRQNKTVRSHQPQARSHQPQALSQASSCSNATSHVAWRQDDRDTIMDVLCTQMIDVPSKVMFERTPTNELYSFCVQYSNVGGGKSAPTQTCKECSTKCFTRHAVLACSFPTTFAK